MKNMHFNRKLPVPQQIKERYPLTAELAAVKEAKRLSGQVLWLNPLAENHWKHQKSAQIMASVCTMVSCNTLSALSNACKRLIQH